jgi:hypothetical protein
MKKLFIFLTSLFVMIIFGLQINAQTLLLNEQFDYPAGDSLTAWGWTAHSGTTYTIKTTAGSLSYTGYPAPAGNKASLTVTGQDVNKPLSTVVTSGPIYVAALVNISDAQAAGDYFFHLMKPGSTSPLVARVYVKKDTTVTPNKFKFGFMKGSTVTNLQYTTANYDFNTTHLIVLKYVVISGNTNDSAFLFINPPISNEGIPTLKAIDVSQTDLDVTAQAVALRQGTATNAPTLTIDEIRVATNWNDAIGYTGVITAPTVQTGTATNITQNSATCSGNVLSDGGDAITERGICYSTSANPTTSDSKVIVAGTTGAFDANLTGLSLGQTYNFRAYAINSIGTSYGNNETFTTASGAVAPIVTTGTVSAITANSATVAGEVVNDGGAAITERGICWSTTSNPTVNDSKVAVSGTTGTFSGNLTGLNASTLYYARAYATNSQGVSYGANVSFTTSVPTIQVINIGELRSKTADNSTLYQISGEVVLTYKQINRNQKFIQDASGAILIDDPNPAKITTVYNIGDGITGLKGKLYNYFGYLEFIPVEDPGPATSTNNAVNPIVLTMANFADTNLMKEHQAKLVKLENISFTDANGTNKFLTNRKYRMTQNASTDSLFFTNFYTTDYINSVIPTGSGSVTGIVTMSYSKYYITSRAKADISMFTGINDISNDQTGIYPNPSNGKFFIKLENYRNIEIKIYSMVGKLIHKQELNKAVNEIDLSGFGKGMYFVKFTNTNDNKTWTEKVIVQ